MIKNNYLSIAQNDLEYLEAVLSTGNTFYNQLAVQCQQVAEKYLKGYLDTLYQEQDAIALLKNHNLKRIGEKLNELYPYLQLDTNGLAYLTDFYYGSRYPGDDFSNVTKEEFDTCLSIMYETLDRLEQLAELM